MFRVRAGVFACLWVLSAPLLAKDAAPLVLARGSRVAVVTVLNPEVIHYHTGRTLQDGFLKTVRVDWPVSSMFMDALKDRASQMGLVLVPTQVTDELDRVREECFLDGNFTKSLPKECTLPFAHLGSSNQVQAIIVLAPSLNNSAHGGSARRKELPDSLRGWGFVTGEAASPDGKPTLFNITEMLVVAMSPAGPQLRAREWGGNYALEWSSFVAPPQIKEIPAEDYAQLRPFFEAILSRQSARLLDQIEIGP
jgi:hypothetical protein